MIAKVWKKVLLAICIIACLYNVMHKLISRTSLEIQLNSVKDQSSLLEEFNQTNNQTNNQTDEEQTDDNVTDSYNVEETGNENTDSDDANTKISDDDDRIVVIY